MWTIRHVQHHTPQVRSDGNFTLIDEDAVPSQMSSLTIHGATRGGTGSAAPAVSVPAPASELFPALPDAAPGALIRKLYVHYTYTIRKLYVHYTYTIRTPYVHHTYTIHTLCIHQRAPRCTLLDRRQSPRHLRWFRSPRRIIGRVSPRLHLMP